MHRTPAIPTAEGNGPWPLSFAQSRLWLADQLAPDKAAYNLPGTITWKGPLDVAALQRALDSIVARHEPLRTTYRSSGDDIVQVIAPNVSVPLEIITADGSFHIERIADTESRRPFDLRRDPMLRAVLISRSEQDHVLLLNFHHIALDGRAFKRFLRELGQYYSAYTKGVEPDLSELPIRYRDYAVWERQYFQGETLRADLDYWTRQLEGVEILELPTDRPRPANPSLAGAWERIVLPPDLFRSLQDFQRRENVSEFVLLLAGFETLLHRYSRQDDFCVGAPLANRTNTQTMRLIGLFNNTAVLRAGFHHEPTFREVLQRVDRTVRDAQAHQQLPFEKLLEALHPEHGGTLQSPFRVMFRRFDWFEPNSLLPVVDIKENCTGTSKFDLTLSIENRGGQFEVILEYSTELFDRATAVRLLKHYRAVLERAVDEPDTPVSRLPILDRAEKHQLLTGWNDTQCDYPPLLVHELFEAQAQKRPDAVALVFRGEETTYSQLNRRANQFAEHLLSLDLEPQSRIGICLPRCPDMLAALLGILKVGCAYVPLDPDYPPERLNFQIADAGLSAVVTENCAIPQSIETPAEPRPKGAVSPSLENLAYILYTSGSTGKPKGVEVLHRGLVNLLHSMAAELQFSEHDSLFAVTTLSFDISMMELLMPLIGGGRVVLVEREVARDGRRVRRELESSGATVMQATPATWRMLIESGWQGSSSLKICCGGEKLDRSLADELLKRGHAVWNCYGPTETTIWSATSRVEAGPGPVLLGRPVANTQLYVLDRHCEPVPLGAAGELYIGGDGVARGYRNHPELTAARFVPNPFGEGRLHKTGDLVRYRPDGQLEFLGRADDQVKLRGFRVELGEVEAALAAHPSIQCAAAAVREIGQDKQLVAYYVSRPDSPLTASALQSHLRTQLPEYMIPAAFVALNELPLTANGKVNRRALPAPDLSAPVRRHEFVAPKTAEEISIVRIWSEILSCGEIGLHDNFFEIGGQSLLAARVMNRIWTELQVDLPLSELFQHPTVAALATRMIEYAPAQSAPAIRRLETDNPCPLSFGQKRIWLLNQILPDPSAYNIAVVLEWESVNADALGTALNTILARHEPLRTNYRSTAQSEVQVVAQHAIILIEVIDRSQVEQEARRPFDLSKDRMVRAFLAENTVLLTFHHIAVDEWSAGIFLREFAEIYTACLQNRTPQLPDLPVRYRDYAAWQRDWLRGETLDRELDYWKTQLAGIQPLDLPSDRPRPSTPTGQGACETAILPQVLSQRLRAFSREEGVSHFTLLLAAFQTLLHRYTGQDDICVASPVANRPRKETESLIGFFLNTLILRADFQGAPTFRALLKQVAATVRDALSHQSAPFDLLVEALQPGRGSQSPLIQAMCVWNDRLESPMPEITSIRPVHTGTAKFDLTLFLEDRPEGISSTLEYATDMFDSSTARRILGHWQALLEEILRDPDREVSAVPYLTEVEQQVLNYKWNDTKSPLPRLSLPQMFEAQAERSPNAIAASDAHGQLSYSELNCQANRIAHHLQSLGVGPDARVAICLPRSLDMLSALLGVLKAGGAYVPVDLEYPAQRIEFLLEDSKASIVITPETNLAMLPAHENNPPSTIEPDHLAYVIYTSGSTGTPKGVAMRHGALANLIAWQTRAPRQESPLRTAQFASICFDVSFQEIFSTWSTGGALMIIDEESRRDSRELLRFLQRNRIERLFLPFVALEQLAEVAVNLSLFPDFLREVITAGEQLRITPAIRQFFAKQPECRLHNHYGPSETHVVTAYTLDGDPQSWPALPPIGKPISNCEVWVLDQHRELVPTGVPGELYLGGECLARGYLDREQLTAERFVDHPFRPGHRLYRTGDRVRWSACGELEFLGRLDDQVKIRGFRVELGEVEAALAIHPGVGRVVAAVRKNGAGENRLVAFYTTKAGDPPESSELYRHVRERLPEYMTPAAFVHLESLPLTKSGKVDRRALPAGASSTIGGAGFVAPRTPVEEQIAGMWAEVLGRSRVGIHDNFFELGGHSLSAARVMNQIRESFHIELSLRALFDHPTVAELAPRVVMAPIVSLPAGRESVGPWPLSYAQDGLWLLDRFLPDKSAYNVPIAVDWKGAIDLPALEASLNTLVHRHESLRTTYHMGEHSRIQIVEPPMPAPLRVVSLPYRSIARRRQETARILREEARLPFDLSADIMVRAVLVSWSPRNHILLLTFHHIAVDGWSLRIFLRELKEIYHARVNGKQPQLPAISLRYRDYAARQLEPFDGASAESELAYWTKQLEGMKALELPLDRPRPAEKSYRGAWESITIPADLAESLRQLALQEGMTLYGLLLAAFQALLYRYSGQDDICVGSPIANRTSRETEGLIGLFVNTLVMRTRFRPDLTFRDLLRDVRTMLVEAQAHQQLPFERLASELPRVMFAFQQPFEGFRVRYIETGTAKFDLSLFLQDGDGETQALLEYSTDLYDVGTAQRILGHYRKLLTEIVKDCGQPVSRIPILPGKESRRLLVDWNRTAWECPPVCAHELFEHQAQKTPDAIAVIYENQHLTYAELDSQADRIANLLKSLRLPAESRIGLYFRPSINMLAALLGILKAGDSYVPLDPDYPEERLRFVIHDADLAAILTESAMQGGLPENRARVLSVDLLDGSVSDAPPRTATPESIAYVLYTSGSTGQPKGALITHRGLVNYLWWAAAAYRLHEGGGSAVHSSISFDLTITSLLAPLVAGQRVILLAGAPGVEALREALETYPDLTLVKLTPSHLRLLSRSYSMDGAAPRYSPRLFVIGGEALFHDDVRFWRDCSPAVRLVNEYGPTETVVGCCAHEIAEGASGTGPAPIGRPIANTQLYVLDSQMQPVPIGVTGELYIGGAGVARGYLNRPELTARSFVPNLLVREPHTAIPDTKGNEKCAGPLPPVAAQHVPFSGAMRSLPSRDQRKRLSSGDQCPTAPSSQPANQVNSDPDSRLYKTGDLVRYRPDGNLEYLGRMDDQVKIRGFRVEIGEVEAAFAAHPAVASTAVVLVEDQLIAYYAAKPGSAPASRELRNFVRLRLPDYMIPARFVELEAIPLTSNGKVDRRALPAPEPPAQEQDSAPGTPIEELLAAIWHEVLQVDSIGIHDNFFELGGHSLLAMQMGIRIRQQLHIEVPLADIFENATIADLAVVLLEFLQREEGPVAAVTECLNCGST